VKPQGERSRASSQGGPAAPLEECTGIGGGRKERGTTEETYRKIDDPWGKKVTHSEEKGGVTCARGGSSPGGGLAKKERRERERRASRAKNVEPGSRPISKLEKRRKGEAERCNRRDASNSTWEEVLTNVLEWKGCMKKIAEKREEEEQKKTSSFSLQRNFRGEGIVERKETF